MGVSWMSRWLRGCLPSNFIKIQTPPVLEEKLAFLFREPAGYWRYPKLWTDASGGEYGSIPQLRRCGVGIAAVALTSQGVQIEFGAFGALAGEHQTVPRGELYAIVVAFECTHHAQPLEVVTDSLVNQQLYSKGPRATAEAANADLWQRLWAILKVRTAPSSIRWTKGQSTWSLEQCNQKT